MFNTNNNILLYSEIYCPCKTASCRYKNSVKYTEIQFKSMKALAALFCRYIYPDTTQYIYIT